MEEEKFDFCVKKHAALGKILMGTEIQHIMQMGSVGQFDVRKNKDENLENFEVNANFTNLQHRYNKLAKICKEEDRQLHEKGAAKTAKRAASPLPEEKMEEAENTLDARSDSTEEAVGFEPSSSTRAPHGQTQMRPSIPADNAADDDGFYVPTVPSLEPDASTPTTNPPSPPARKSTVTIESGYRQSVEEAANLRNVLTGFSQTRENHPSIYGAPDNLPNQSGGT